MDAVGAVLNGHRARGAFLLRCLMSPPWSVRIADRARVGLIAVVHGHVWIVRADRRIRLEPGDLIVLTGAEPYVLADDPGTAPSVGIEPGQICRTLDETAVPIDFGFGLRTWGNSADGSTAFLTGTYELPSQVTGRILDAIPDEVVLRAGEWDAPAISWLTAEFARDAPGQDVVLDRLMDLVLVAALREWFDRAARNDDSEAAPGWWLAQQDPVIGNVLRLMHDCPERPWTLGTLASAVAVSRATLARRFTRLVGEPPMSYLAEWRLSLAADLLIETTDTIEVVSRRVGYANAFGFSTAFKRRFGQSPREFRQSAAA